MAAADWRTIEARLIMAGIADPLRMLPSMHAVLNVVELMLLETCEKASDREDMIRRLYRPIDDEVPAGFSAAEQRASVEGFLGAFDGLPDTE